MFIPRHPVVENQFCQYKETDKTAGVGGVIAYAGAVCYLQSTATNQEAVVSIYDFNQANETTVSGERTPFGFLMQKVKVGYHNVHPAGFMMPGDLGSSDVIAQPKYSATGAINGSRLAPVGVAHLGIWDTVHYVVPYTGTLGTATATAGMLPGQHLYVANDTLTVDGNGTSKVTNDNLTVGGETYGRYTNVTTVVAKVVKGASTAQCQASINNTTLYPIRIKLLI